MADFSGGSDDKASVYHVGDLGSIPREVPWRRKWQPTPVLLPGKDHGPWTEEPGVHAVAKSRTRLSDFTFFLSHYGLL